MTMRFIGAWNQKYIGMIEYYNRLSRGDTMDQSDWLEHKKMILAEIETAKKERLEEIHSAKKEREWVIQKYNELALEVAVIKVKVGMMALGISAIVSIIVGLSVKYLSK